jgi:hypothetical protein
MMLEGMERMRAHQHAVDSKEKGLAGMRTTVELGYRAGGRAPLGYRLVHQTTGQRRAGQLVKKSTLALDPEWAPKVKRFFAHRAAGRGRKIAAGLSGLGGIEQTSLIGMERNALTYAGHTVWNRHVDRKVGGERYRPRSEWIVQRDTHPAMIEEEKAEAIMNAALPKGRKRGTSNLNFLLTGLLFTPQGEKYAASGDDYYRVGKGRRPRVRGEVRRRGEARRCGHRRGTQGARDRSQVDRPAPRRLGQDGGGRARIADHHAAVARARS